MKFLRVAAAVAAACSLAASDASAQRITTPREEFGRDLGADYFLANYRQLTTYWQKLDRESDRMRLERIGTTSEGRPMWMAVITSPENHRRLGRYQEIARRLALGQTSGEAEARRLAAEGKAVVWIDGGLHASEVLGAQQLMELVWELVSRGDAETRRFLRDVVVLAVPANPDGHDLVADWYMRHADTLHRSTSRLPRLYHKYIGHDNNRDSYMATQRETQAMDSIMFRAWYPQIMYNHHQTAPDGTIMFAPPFRDPFNYNFDPLVVTMLDQVGAAMHSRMIAEGKPGTVMRGGASFSTWWNGGLRTTAYFHNMIGLLTETFGSPTPTQLPLDPERWLPSGNLPYPVFPQLWRFRRSMDYERTANRAVLDFASRHREELLFNTWRMAHNSIERGGRDNWTLTPTLVGRADSIFVRDTLRGDAGPATKYVGLIRDPRLRDPRAYVVPANQPDFLTATKFVNALIKTGVTVQRASAPFTAAGRSYPSGSYVVLAAQPFRPHVRDMFEPQDYPNDFQYPGGPPIAPYDVSGYTLAYQMGIQFDRILEGVSGPFQPLAGQIAPPAGRMNEMANAAGYLLSHRQNDAFVAVNRLLAAGQEVNWMQERLTVGGASYAPGTFFVPARPRALEILRAVAAEKGVGFDAVASIPSENARRVRPVRIGLWDSYGGSMTSGWTRWILEQFEFSFRVVFPPELDAGDLGSRFDVIVLPDGARTIERERRTRARELTASATAPDDAPAEWKARSGVMTETRTLPQLRRFLEGGGTILAIGDATELAYQLGVPITNALVDSTGGPLPEERFYIPGSVLRARMNNAHPLAHGMGDEADVFFRESPAFRTRPGFAERGGRVVAWYDTAEPLRSGWAWGQRHLEGAAQVIEFPVGRGTLVLYAPEVLFRAQAHGTFKLFFNGIYYGGAARR